MDLTLPPAGEALRREAVEWLDSWTAANRSDAPDPRLDLGLRRRYQRDAYDAGWLLPAAPVGRGGREVDAETELWIKLDFARRGAPKLPNVQGPGVVAQALLGFGTAAQQKFVEPVSRGDAWWCLGMSEPEAGSDLASLRTRARKGEDGSFTIDGQKVWTSHARESEHCLLFTRTGQPGSGHRGITAFIVPMSAPGITVRRIEKIGVEDEEFCEIFFDGVVVAAAAMLGPLNGGWKVAMSSLSHERDMVWIMNLVEIEEALDIIRVELSRAARPALALELGVLEADADSIWLSGLRGLAARLDGKPDDATTLLKLFSTEAAQRAYLLAARSRGPDAAILADSSQSVAGIAAGEIEALGATIYGGTSEVQRNIIGERILGLPR